MIPVIPLAVAGALAVFAFAMAKRDESAPALPGGQKDTTSPPKGAMPAQKGSAPAGSLPGQTTAKSGDENVAHADDAFDQAVAQAIAKGDPKLLEYLAEQAEKMGLLTVAKSLRDEIARLKQAAPSPTPPGPDKPVPTPALATYIVKSGDTGSSIAKAFTGNANRWPELVTVNPSTKDAKWGFKAYPGQRINLPASWPSGIPVPLPSPTPPPVPHPIAVPPPPSPISLPPPPPPALNTYTVVAGDTGEKVAQKFVNDKSRWRELLTVNPSLKSAQYGIALYTGHKINLPATWPATPGYAAPALPPAPTPPPPPIPSAPPPLPGGDAQSLPMSDSRVAAQQLTDYLIGLGGLSARYKEDQTQVKGYQDRIGGTALPSDGKYGRGTAAAIMQEGLIPVAPFYWPRTNTQTAKDQFLSLVRNFAAADPQRKTQWDKLIADTIRS